MEKGAHQGMMDSLTRRKPISKGLEQSSGNEKVLTWYDLSAYGISATVGSGIYVTCGAVAMNLAGPSVIISTVIAGLLSFLTGICYLEFASSLPISGSGYAYFYTMMGEFLGWFIGWNLTLEYAFSAAVIAAGWTDYLVDFAKNALGCTIPEYFYAFQPFASLGEDSSSWLGRNIHINFIAALIVFLVGIIVSRGVKFGAFLTNLVTIVNIGIILFIIIVGGSSVRTANWKPFLHESKGLSGIFQGSGDMFFSFIGYDTVSTLAGEAINPARDLPIAVFLTVGVATTLYVGVGLVLTGMVPYTSLDEKSPLAKAFEAVGHPWAAHVVSTCALFTMSATIFTCLAGQPKILQSIAKDGLLPQFFAREDRRSTPIRGVLLTTLLTAMVAAFFRVQDGLFEFISFGTLFGMSLLCTGLMVVRLRQHEPCRRLGASLSFTYFFGCIIASLVSVLLANPLIWSFLVSLPLVFLPFIGLVYLFVLHGDHLRPKPAVAFACPLMPVIPCLAIAANSFLMIKVENLLQSAIKFGSWTVIGLLIYFGYGIKHSHMNI